MTYYTIRHSDTHEPLGFGGPLDRQKAIDILGMRTTATVNGKSGPFVRSEWYVTAWIGTGADDDEIDSQMGADEFYALAAAEARVMRKLPAAVNAAMDKMLAERP